LNEKISLPAILLGCEAPIVCAGDDGKKGHRARAREQKDQKIKKSEGKIIDFPEQESEKGRVSE
jgi:hypothetical protein